MRTADGAALRLPAGECCLQNERDDTVDDLVKSDFLHEPGWVHLGFVGSAFRHLGTQVA